MNKVIVRTLGLRQAINSLLLAGCQELSIELVPHAVKVQGTRQDGEPFTLHVWSKEAEETAASVGKGRTLTEEECKLLDDGKCPVCEKPTQLYKGPKEGLAINVSCDAGHIFWVPPQPLVPEYLGTPKEEAPVIEEEVMEKVEEAVAVPEEGNHD